MFYALIIFTLVKGLVLTLLIPFFQIPDETTHYDYAVYLSKIDLVDFIGGRHRFSEIEMGPIVTQEVLKLMEDAEFGRIASNPRERVKAGLWEIIKKARAFKEEDTQESLAQIFYLLVPGPRSLDGRPELAKILWPRLRDLK